MIKVLTSSPLVTVQDLGRHGQRRLGIGTAGAMDRLALTVANLMLQNDPAAAAIEVTGSPLRISFQRDTAVALTGADAEASIDGVGIPPWWMTTVRAGSVLNMKAPCEGLRCYLGLGGGIDLPLVQGSRSTDVKSAFGGMCGRGLLEGDELALLPSHLDTCGSARPTNFGVRSPRFSMDLVSAGDEAGDLTPLRILPGPQYDCFKCEAKNLLWSDSWAVQPDSNRMGLRLSGAALEQQRPQELLSHGIIPGVVQVPSSGQPIIQAADGNTCGGYPIIGVVIGADLWRIGQVRPGRRVRFIRVDWRAARDALAEYDKYLQRMTGLIALAYAAGAPTETRALGV